MAASSPLRVLLIEDDLDVLESLRDLIEHCAHLVEVAGTGIEGLERARAFQPHVVVCDIGLPMLDGMSVARRLRADPALPDVRLIAFTADGDLGASARDAGFDHYVLKSGRLEQLLSLVACSKHPADRNP